MKKVFVLCISSLLLFSCGKEQKSVESPKIPDSTIVKVCDSLIFDGNTKIKIKLKSVNFNGEKINVGGECVLTLSREN